jgi:hypothetical protein
VRRAADLELKQVSRGLYTMMDSIWQRNVARVFAPRVITRSFALSVKELIQKSILRDNGSVLW